MNPRPVPPNFFSVTMASVQVGPGFVTAIQTVQTGVTRETVS